MLRIAAFCIGFALSTALAVATGLDEQAPAGAYKTDPSHSSLLWSFNHSGLSNYTARFTGVDARLDWNPIKPEASKLMVEIDPMSVRTDYPWPGVVDFDAKIGGDPDFLAGKPIRFVSSAMRITGERTGIVEGVVTFRDQTHPASLNVTVNGSMAEHPMMGVPKIGFSATGSIRRSGWGLGFAIPELGDEVKLVIETQMVPADYAFR
ncbi:YceI family protein [Sinorhizobium americanum]|uniref:Polyisoprenoid-binding protein YceI n=1 Tax=Sinorhizobium americanum TaxID=194963 RepID=A0A4R2ARI6_9HYPH|nr:YceI family protein [Sinorhizobium americanum]TCN15069.1 polyisoprenoid-binding protein YceI [Sinorhizobium americanum]